VWAIKRRELRSFLWNLQGIFYPTKAWQEKKGGTIGPQQAQRSDRKKKGKQDKIE
jgi:hypothetical protein